MRHPVVDVFADERFAGNPAAVVLAGSFPADAEMQDEAHRIGLPTTAFLVPAGPQTYRVRWFTPYAEINLCGHATIASARYLFAQDVDAGHTRLSFVSANGVLHAGLDGDLVALDLPAAATTVTEPPPGLLDALGVAPVACAVSSDDVLVELDSAAAVAAVRPDFPALARLPFRGHIVTAPGPASGAPADFVSRTFFPSLGVDEDQVCVTAHAKLAPYWSARLGARQLDAVQLSERGGRLRVRQRGARVSVAGTAVPRTTTAEATTVGAR
jgi:PhzF family phenazine biosynthesis protein